MKKLILSAVFTHLLIAGSNLCNLLPAKVQNYVATSKCEYTNVESNSQKSMQASRDYKNGKKQITLQLLKGGLASQMMSSFMMPMQIETDEIIMKVTKCKSFKCAITYNKKDKGGVVIVLLDENTPSIISVMFENTDIGEIYNIVNKIELSKIKNEL